MFGDCVSSMDLTRPAWRKASDGGTCIGRQTKTAINNGKACVGYRGASDYSKRTSGPQIDLCENMVCELLEHGEKRDKLEFHNRKIVQEAGCLAKSAAAVFFYVSLYDPRTSEAMYRVSYQSG